MCAILYCQVKTVSPWASAPSGDPLEVSQTFSEVTHLAIFRASNSTATEDSARQHELLASVNTQQTKARKFLQDFNVFGTLKSDKSYLRMRLMNQNYCESDFVCQAQGKNLEGRELVSTTRLAQLLKKKDDDVEEGGQDLSLPSKLLTAARQADVKMMFVEKTLRDLDMHVKSMDQFFSSGFVALEKSLGDRLTAGLRSIEDKSCQTDSMAPTNDSPGAEKTNSQALQDILASTDRFEGALNSTVDRLILELKKSGVKTCKQERYDSAIEASKSSPESTLSPEEMTTQQGRAATDDLFPGTCKKVEPVVQVKGESGLLGEPFVCDMATQDGGWIVIQRRATGKENFLRGWDDYKNGFGTFDDDFWLGNDKIHAMTSTGTYELRVELEFEGKQKFAHYKTFVLGDEASNYLLTVDGYSGTAGDSLSRHSGDPFTTIDRDNDRSFSRNCAQRYRGAWWYINCHDSNLNGEWDSEDNFSGLMWKTFTGRKSASFSEMKIRRVED